MNTGSGQSECCLNATITSRKSVFEQVSKEVEADAKLPLQFYDTQWYSTYRLHHKKIAQFRKGNVFFCGDAAHVHSPAAGQGMNTGLQDAYNLAWKLALVIRQQANERLLDTYHEERNPVAETLLHTTDRLFSMFTNKSLLLRIFRMYIVPFVVPGIMKNKRVRRAFFRFISQTAIAYSNSSLSKGKAGAICAGMRLPYVKLAAGREWISLYQIVKQHAAKPMLLLHYNVPEPLPLHSSVLSVAALEKNHLNDIILKKAGFTTSFVLLLRPDLYIGFISGYYNVKELKEYLDIWYNEKQ